MKKSTHIIAGMTILVSLLFFSCNSKPKNTTTIKTVNKATKKIQTPKFNSDSAYHYIAQQVNFGPRVPNTEEHTACAVYLSNELKRFGADVITQEADVIAFDNTVLKAKNIIGQFNPEKNNRLLLFAHWDTRPFADYDTNENKRNSPIDGANDGGSGVGVLLEIARLIGETGHNLGIDIILFDAEDYGQPAHINLPHKEHTWCLGSQYWGNNPHKANYSARYGILLDMVGASNALFYREIYSQQFAPELLNTVWNTANDLGYGHHFVYDQGGMITDDHVYVSQLRNIPCIDIIQHDPSSATSFGSFWHTHNDNMDGIDKKTLEAVGQTVLEVIYNEK